MQDIKNNVIVMEGRVAENLPNTMFRVVLKEEKTQAERIILCYLSGKMRQHFIKILPGDMVRVEITPYDPGKGRIIYRKSV